MSITETSEVQYAGNFTLYIIYHMIAQYVIVFVT